MVGAFNNNDTFVTCHKCQRVLQNFGRGTQGYVLFYEGYANRIIILHATQFDNDSDDCHHCFFHCFLEF